MESARGEGRGSYIWGRSVHNVRIERLWVDVTVQVGAKWADFFTDLEMHHGLNINNVDHIWLLHIIFLPIINAELQFFAESWNEHKIDSRTGPRRSPWDMFVFDMLVHGVRGDPLHAEQQESLSQAELEVYGVDWPALHQQNVRDAQALNNPRDEGHTSWIGQQGPPPQLGGVELEPPAGSINASDYFVAFSHSTFHENQMQRWVDGLALAHSLYPELF
ncbi:hypothetical protein SISSUDRAFT_991708 [Sistotremastrum suecicum HHB10207 ss-3]|uniref:Integrase core domain-containing protein n=1 Tax=Sistotremastrum suecicum HHB10207 ss-3 TaxID=1314776 RepID=A0A165ZR70_9AGAM|nr:hypothetical protein SISSUDRAFT_991708 [Sistotremastrum suecicum HHB10207 ss-3]